MEVKKILEEFKREIKKIYGERLKKIILYRSYARGEAAGDSDIDLLIVLEEMLFPEKKSIE